MTESIGGNPALAAEQLISLLSAGKSIVFFTGAGISTGSGIPDFRSPGGIWSRYRIIALDEFLASEAARLEDWERRFHMSALLATAKPNAAHDWIARLVREGRSSGVITQNIDGLHQKAGMAEANVVEFHGTGAHAHCLSCGKRHEINQMRALIESERIAPRCDCGGLVKAAVISFGEAIPDDVFRRAEILIDSADFMVAIGTSLQVWPASGLLERGLVRKVPLIILNRDVTPFHSKSIAVFTDDLTEIAENIAKLLF